MTLTPGLQNLGLGARGVLDTTRPAGARSPPVVAVGKSSSELVQKEQTCGRWSPGADIMNEELVQSLGWVVAPRRRLPQTRVPWRSVAGCLSRDGGPASRPEVESISPRRLGARAGNPPKKQHRTTAWEDSATEEA